MKLFTTSNIEIVSECRCEFAFQLPSVLLSRRTENFLCKVAQIDGCIAYYTNLLFVLICFCFLCMFSTFVVNKVCKTHVCNQPVPSVILSVRQSVKE